MVHGLTLGGTRLSRMVVIRQRVKMAEHLTTIPTAVNRESPLFLSLLGCLHCPFHFLCLSDTVFSFFAAVFGTLTLCALVNLDESN